MLSIKPFSCIYGHTAFGISFRILSDNKRNVRLHSLKAEMLHNLRTVLIFLSQTEYAVKCHKAAPGVSAREEPDRGLNETK
jgi:hypothetical protein